MSTDAPLTVLYDGACPLCRREIALYRGLQAQAPLCFADVSDPALAPPAEATRAALLARFHVRHADGRLESGAAAFVALWARLPGWRWLARAARLPGVLWALERAYRFFLRWRPALQRRAARWEAGYLARELRSDHAGEAGAVAIYAGILAVTRDPALRAFALRHQATEAGHLQRIEAWLPPARRSRLLPAWRLAGWLTGALPALAGPRAVYATVAAVETFVDRHYQQQIEHLQAHPGSEGTVGLLDLLQACQADECEHRDEAAAGGGAAPSRLLRAWCALVGAGSAGAVVLARRF
jgi:demethoxyubiquinone hydroxylase (CLK1/Coq7/Cat5 family)